MPIWCIYISPYLFDIKIKIRRCFHTLNETFKHPGF